MDTRHAFAQAFREIRKSRGLTQEDFGVVSSRTYVSTLERGMKSPTLDKIEALSTVLGVHPLTVLALTYMHAAGETSLKDVFAVVLDELDEAGKPGG